YGDDPSLPKREDQLGTPLSPYAATKLIDEIYARAFAAAYGLQSIALRYFNVFGPRQDPAGAYAAVIPLWIALFVRNETVYVMRDGETSRDFCYIDNVIQANVLAATTQNPAALDQAYNVAVGERITLNSLLSLIWKQLSGGNPANPFPKTEYRDFRPGDVRHS